MRSRILVILLLLLLCADGSEAQRRSRRRVPPRRARQPFVLVDKVIPVTDGVVYSHETYPRSMWSVHTLTADLSNPELDLRMVKGLEHVSGLERVGEMADRFDSAQSTEKVLAAVNSNFWKAGSNYVIGPAVSNGEIINNLRYKNWSSLVVTERREAIIDRIALHLRVETKDTAFPIRAVNRRLDSATVSMYSRFYGPSVPFIDTIGIRLRSQDTLTDASEMESLSIAAIDSLWTVNPEKGTVKVQFQYVTPPAVNGVTRCFVTSIDTCAMNIPLHGGVLSIGYSSAIERVPFLVGDMFTLRVDVDPPPGAPVTQIATGTPRLVRNGAVSVEWEEEGLHKRTFVTGRFARSAIGVSRSGKKIILVTVEPTIRKKRQRGIGLPDFARLLIAKGAYNAMNFDGGSSATMVVGARTVAPPNGNGRSRKVASALMLVGNAAGGRDKKVGDLGP